MAVPHTPPFVDGDVSQENRVTAEWLNWVNDEVYSFIQLALPSGAGNIGYIQNRAGAVATTAQRKLRESVSVLDFGAVGNGVADDTYALTAAEAASDVVYFPQGDYKLTVLPTLGKSWGPGKCYIAGERVYLHPVPGPVAEIFASVYEPDITLATDSAPKLQAAINQAQDVNLPLTLQANADYRVDTSLIFKHGRSSTDSQSYHVNVQGNGAIIRPNGPIYGFVISPRCLLADAGTGRGVASINITNINFDGYLSPTTGGAITIGSYGYVCDNFAYSQIKDILATSFINSATMNVIEARHIQFTNIVLRGSGFYIEARNANSFAGDCVLQTCEFSTSGPTITNLSIQSGGVLNTNAQVRGIKFESCTFYGSSTTLSSSGIASQIGDIWFTGCQWDAGYANRNAIELATAQSGQMFGIHFVSPYIVNYGGKALYAESGSGTMQDISVQDAQIGTIAATASVFDFYKAEGVSVNNCRFYGIAATNTLINFDSCTDVSVNNNVSTNSPTVPYGISIGNTSTRYSFTGNMFNCLTAILNDYSSGVPVQQAANNLKV